MATIDLNADLGEGDAYDQELLQVVSSCNIACGGHAGDAASMQLTTGLAIANEVAIGAHPGYPDVAGFGRRKRFLAGRELQKSIASQIDTLMTIVQRAGGTLHHVKPHGALYSEAGRDESIAASIVLAVQAVSGGRGDSRAATKRAAATGG